MTTKKKVSKEKKEVTTEEVLEFLKKEGKALPQSAVDLYFGFKKATLWNQLDKLVRAGKVTKTKGQADGDPDERKTMLYTAK